MKTAVVFGAMLASVALFAGPAAAHKVPKAFQCVPIEGNSSPAYGQTCDVWFTNGEFAGECGCADGFSLVDPRSTLLTIQDEDGSASPGKASGS
jgi:hypothetical protein